jgi:hypothetical protein
VFCSICFLQGITLANHAVSFNVVLYPFAVKFKPTQQALLVAGNVHGQVAVGLLRYFLSSPYRYDIDDSFFIYHFQVFFYNLFFIVTFDLNHIIKLNDLIGYSQVNDSSIEFFLILSKHYWLAASKISKKNY